MQRNAPRALLLGLAMAAVMGALVIGLRGQYSAWLARHWQSRLDEASDDQVPMLLAGVARLDEPGIPVLVEACGSERESVARAGWNHLMEQFRRWESLPPAEASRRLAVLAESLAQHVQRFGPTARRDAAQLATRILRWPLDPTAVDRGLVVASCEQVLHATAPDRVLLAQRRKSRGVTYLALGGDRPSPQAVKWMADDRSPDDNAPERHTAAAGSEPKRSMPLPDVIIRLPNVSADGSDRPPVIEIAIAGSSGRGGPPAIGLRQPERFAPVPEGPVSEGPVPEGPVPEGPVPEGPVPEDPVPEGPVSEGPVSEDPSGASARSFPNHRASLPSPASSESSAKMGDRWHPPDGFAAADPLEHALERIETVQLMRRLHDSDPRLAMRAETELTRRGFSVLHMELARQLFHPDVEVRKRLAQGLPGTTGVNAVPWLRQLSRDRDPQVRMTAITLMATTGEPSLLDEIEQIAARDPSPRVRQQAKRMAEHRRARTY